MADSGGGFAATAAVFAEEAGIEDAAMAAVAVVVTAGYFQVTVTFAADAVAEARKDLIVEVGLPVDFADSPCSIEDSG